MSTENPKPLTPKFWSDDDPLPRRDESQKEKWGWNDTDTWRDVCNYQLPARHAPPRKKKF